MPHCADKGRECPKTIEGAISQSSSVSGPDTYEMGRFWLLLFAGLVVICVNGNSLPKSDNDQNSTSLLLSKQANALKQHEEFGDVETLLKSSNLPGVFKINLSDFMYFKQNVNDIVEQLKRHCHLSKADMISANGTGPNTLLYRLINACYYGHSANKLLDDFIIRIHTRNVGDAHAMNVVGTESKYVMETATENVEGEDSQKIEDIDAPNVTNIHLIEKDLTQKPSTVHRIVLVTGILSVVLLSVGYIWYQMKRITPRQQ